MNPELKQRVEDFISRMNRDLDEMREMLRTEDNLMKAVEEYERAWKVKIKVINESSNPS